MCACACAVERRFCGYMLERSVHAGEAGNPKHEMHAAVPLHRLCPRVDILRSDELSHSLGGERNTNAKNTCCRISMLLHPIHPATPARTERFTTSRAYMQQCIGDVCSRLVGGMCWSVLPKRASAISATNARHEIFDETLHLKLLIWIPRARLAIVTGVCVPMNDQHIGEL